jgi:hypothetical protein
VSHARGILEHNCNVKRGIAKRVPWIHLRVDYTDLHVQTFVKGEYLRSDLDIV